MNINTFICFCSNLITFDFSRMTLIFQNGGSSAKEEIFFCMHCKKNSTREGRQPPSIVLKKKKTFSRRSRKPPNLRPTHTQRHRISRETGLALDLCFGVRQAREFFQHADKLRHLRPPNSPGRGFELWPAGCKAQRRTNWSSGQSGATAKLYPYGISS